MGEGSPSFLRLLLQWAGRPAGKAGRGNWQAGIGGLSGKGKVVVVIFLLPPPPPATHKEWRKVNLGKGGVGAWG